MDSRLSICLTIYRRLASTYPHEFRMLYGEDLDRLGEDSVPEVWRQFGGQLNRDVSEQPDEPAYVSGGVPPWV